MTAGEEDGSARAAEPGVPPEVATGWQRSEERLYLGALGDVARYRATMELVGTTLAHLRRHGCGFAGLLAAAAQGGELVAEAVPGGSASTVGFDLRLVAEAALALRHREVLAEQAADRRLAALDGARRRGETRVVLEESGTSAGDPVDPYRRLEVDVATGRALLVSATPDEEFRRCVHAVETLRVDLRTGAVEEPDDGGVAPASFADEQARERAAERAWATMIGTCAPLPRSP